MSQLNMTPEEMEAASAEWKAKESEKQQHTEYLKVFAELDGLTLEEVQEMTPEDICQTRCLWESALTDSPSEWVSVTEYHRVKTLINKLEELS